MTDLLKLAERVEAGEFGLSIIKEIGTSLLDWEMRKTPKEEWKTDSEKGGWVIWTRSQNLPRFTTSLDAAKALHDAVLPEWWYCFDGNCRGVEGNNAIVANHNGEGSYKGKANTPAAAWVAAILRAKHAEQHND